MSKRKPKNRSARRRFSTQLEGLEPRILLAGDTLSQWQNPLNRFDVNQDGHVSPSDVLAVRQVLNTQGAHQLPVRASAEPGSANQAAVPMLDSNGDGYVSPIDALLVIEAVNGQGEGEEFRLRVDVTNGAGDVVSEVNFGDTFTLNAYVQDIRGEDAAGVFSAYVDVTYDSSIVSVEQGAAIIHAAPFDDGKSGDISEPGLIDEAGGFDQSGSGDGSEQLLFQLNFVADAVGVVSFDLNPADELPINEFLGHDDLNPVDPADILFDGVQLTVTGASSGATDLAGFAKALDQAGVEFWSTRQFNADAVGQRELFEDAELYLPFNESFDSSGQLNDAANDRNVTEVNTWIFPDESTATGVLSLQELSTRSGVPLPTDMGPTLKQVVANDSVDLELNSPLQLGLDAYDVLNGPVTYTISVDDPSLVESTMIMDNRGWELDIEGYGKMVFEFFEGRAPRATSQFITLTESGFYDGLTLHRILEDFVIQGGDPLGDGTGGSDLPDFDDQFNVDLQHNQIGVLSMAKSGDDTNNSQFFVTDDTTRHLDFNHTIFGQLIEGFDVLDAVSAVPVNPPASQGVPTTPIVIKSARVIDDQENAIVMLRALDSSGTTNVTVTATDIHGNTDSNTFEVNLIDSIQNAEPFLKDLPDYMVPSDALIEFQLEPIDIENDPVLYNVEVISPPEVTATVTDDGRVTVDIPASMNDGEEALVRVRVSDSPVVSINTPRDEQIVSILVGEDVIADDDFFTIDEDSGTHMFDVLANDFATGTLSITAVSAPTDGGTVEISDGKILYTPSANFPFESTTALDSTFTYTISGGPDGRSSVGLVTVTVNPVNDPPTANDDSFPADFDPVEDLDEIRRLREDELNSVKFLVVLNDLVSPDQEIPGITDVFSDTAATLGVENLATAVTYVPGANVFGEDTFTYTLSDPGGLSDTATVTVLIAQVNDAPITTDDSIDVLAGRPQTILAADLLGNDSAGPLEDSIQSISITGVMQPANGTVTLNADGSLTYTANAGFEGTDSFEYIITDDGFTENFDEGSSSFVSAADPLTATGVVMVTSTSLNAAVDDTFVVEIGSGDPEAASLDVLANDDLTLSPTVTAVGNASDGTVEIINDGNDVAYTPDAGFTGADSFTYTITDSEGATSSATVNVTVELENMNPTALDDAFTVSSDGTEHSLDVLANDTVEDGETKTVTAILNQPDNGVVRISEFGDAIIYTPDAGFAGTDTLVYQVDDGNGGTDSAQVTITVELANANPTANDDTLTVSGAIQRPLDVLANDETEDGETLTIDSIVTVPTNGVATISSDGLFILYERIDDDVTQDTLVYQISDGNGGLDTATVNITVLADNQDPVAQDDTVTITGVQTLDVLANDETELGESLTIDSITTDPTQGTATISSDGMSIEYTPNGGATGTDTLTYQINDGNGGTATANVSMTLDIMSQNPVANDDVIEVSPFGEQTLNVLDNDEGETGETLTVTSIGGSPTGTVAINADGTALLYTPSSDSVGMTDTFTYTIDDGTGLTAEATVTVNINALGSSFFAGVVFQDMDNDGQQGDDEMGIGGVMVVLEGTDLNGESVRMETTSSLLGDYRFENIVPGDYMVSQMQPAFLNSGSNTFGLTVTEDDSFEFQVSEELIASDNNTFAELGLPARFAFFDALASSRQPGVFAVLDGDDMAWVENRGGWDDVDSLMLTRDGSDLIIESSAGNGTLSMSDRGMVQLLGRSGTYTMLKINGTSEAVLSAAAVDQAFAS